MEQTNPISRRDYWFCQSVGWGTLTLFSVLSSSFGSLHAALQFALAKLFVMASGVLVPVMPRAGMAGRTLTLGVRPEHIQMGAADLTLTVTPSVIERLGAHTVAYVALDGEGENYCAMLPGTLAIRADETIRTGIRAADCHLFDENGVAFERRVEMTDIDMALFDPAA